MSLQAILSKPQTMASSGILAILLKIISTTFLVMVVAFFTKINAPLLSSVILYPIVASTIDIFLYLFKDRIWQKLPKADTIPNDWKTSAADLLQFAKNLPKVRLMRLLTCWFLIPFMSFDGRFDVFMFTEIMILFSTGFFVCSLFDPFWLKFFKLRTPYSSKTSNNTSKYTSICNTDDLSKDSITTTVGSSAWFAQKNIDSM